MIRVLIIIFKVLGAINNFYIKMKLILKICYYVIFIVLSSDSLKLKLSGPGLGSDIVMPGRYYFIEADDFSEV